MPARVPKALYHRMRFKYDQSQIQILYCITNYHSMNYHYTKLITWIHEELRPNFNKANWKCKDIPTARCIQSNGQNPSLPIRTAPPRCLYFIHIGPNSTFIWGRLQWSVTLFCVVRGNHETVCGSQVSFGRGGVHKGTLAVIASNKIHCCYIHNTHVTDICIETTETSLASDINILSTKLKNKYSDIWCLQSSTEHI